MAAPIQPMTAQDGFAVTKSDSTVQPFDGLWIGGAGNVLVRTAKGNSLTFTGVPAGATLPIAGDKVLNSTTATNIVGLKYS